MPEKVYHQIQYLCKEISRVEWSGVLFYKIEGSIKDPKNMVIILEDILPLDKGTQAYTEYTFDERVVYYIMENEHLEECKIGHIHSHNTMSVFFSGTDMSELQDNAPNHNIYVSLIVNNFMDFCAKVCFVSAPKDQEFEFYAKDENGEEYLVEKESYVVDSKLITYDCEIESPKNIVTVEEGFIGKVKEIIAKAVTPIVTTTNSVVKSVNKWDWNAPETPGRKVDPNKSYNQQFGKGNILEEDTLASAIEFSGEEFTLFVINTGNPLENDLDLEDVCEMYEASRVTGRMLATNVIKTVVSSYQRFFAGYTEDLSNPILFSKALDEVIFELEHVIETTKKPLVKAMLRPSLNGIVELKKKTQNKLFA